MTAPRRKLDIQAFFALTNDPFCYTAEKWSRFLLLYEAELGGDRFYDADADDAWGFVSHFTHWMMVERKYSAAEAELKRLLSHPDVDTVEFAWDFRCRLGLCALGQGREAEAFSMFRGVLESAPHDKRRLVACTIRNHLDGNPGGLERKGMASAEMTTFVQELAAMITRREPRRGRFPTRTSYAKLRKHLWKTVQPPPEPDPLEHVWKQVWERAKEQRRAIALLQQARKREQRAVKSRPRGADTR